MSYCIKHEAGTWHTKPEDCPMCKLEAQLADLREDINALDIGKAIAQVDADDEWVHVPKWWLAGLLQEQGGSR